MQNFIAVLLVTCVLVTSSTGVATAAESAPLSVSHEFRQVGAHLAAETADFAKTPFQIENGNLLVTLGVVSAVGLSYVFDTDIRDKVQRNRSHSVDKAADIAAGVGNPYLHLGLAALVYGGGIAADSARWKSTGEMLGEALILADGATLILKEATGRGRPTVTDHKGDFHPFGFKNNYDSFPSMHTASSFAVASIMARTSGSLPASVLSYSAAVLVGLSRLNQDKHWASDVVLAAALGELAGRVVTWQHARHSSVALVPTALEGGGGVALAGHF
ncbi:MAG TPA: phosphatase PAP2 family protein [Desulfuromonadales bacterium]|nr:phosphatase PAP2 family protein [Desulfuromonadales bacterium]